MNIELDKCQTIDMVFFKYVNNTTCVHKNMFHTVSVKEIWLYYNYMPTCTFCLSSDLLNLFNADTIFNFMISYYVIKKIFHVNLLLCLIINDLDWFPFYWFINVNTNSSVKKKEIISFLKINYTSKHSCIYMYHMLQ